MNKRIIDTGSDFSGVGAFDKALDRAGIKQNKVFACDMDKFARKTYILNYGVPKYYPKNVYDREIPVEPLDIYMTSPPCQSFSNIGKKKGEQSQNGVLFYNSHEFIKKNNPRFFIFENVAGLLSDEKGKTFQRWIDLLGGKSVNGNPVIFPHDESVQYHIYHKKLNSKKFNIPQNRERIFIVGIRDDKDNDFCFPKPINQNRFVKDILENKVDEKYFLTRESIEIFQKKRHNFTGEFRPYTIEKRNAYCITTKAGSRGTDNFVKIGDRIRKLTPRECFRFQDFDDSFQWDVSDHQAFKQAGNSISVGLLAEILKKMKL